MNMVTEDPPHASGLPQKKGNQWWGVVGVEWATPYPEGSSKIDKRDQAMEKQILKFFIKNNLAIFEF